MVREAGIPVGRVLSVRHSVEHGFDNLPLMDLYDEACAMRQILLQTVTSRIEPIVDPGGISDTPRHHPRALPSVAVCTGYGGLVVGLADPYGRL